MGWDAPWHWVILAILVIALFGYKKMPDAARAMGRSLRIFKTEIKGMTEDDRARDARELDDRTRNARDLDDRAVDARPSEVRTVPAAEPATIEQRSSDAPVNSKPVTAPNSVTAPDHSTDAT